MPDVFVSYSRRDTDFVKRLADDLRELGKEVWVDVEGIRDAEKFPDALRRAIEGSDAFVFVISPDSVTSQFCEQEVAHAAELNKRIVPLALHAVPDEAIPDEIRFRNWIPATEQGPVLLERVMAAIDTNIEWEQQHTRLTVKAIEWESSGRDGSFLLRGSDLAAAEHWLAEGAGRPVAARPTELEQQYLLAARQAAARRQRTLVGASVAVAVVAIGLLIFALISRGQAVSAKTSAQAQALAADSENQQPADSELAVLLGMAGVRAKATYGPLGTMFALRAAVDASPIRYALRGLGAQACNGPGLAYDPAPRANLLAVGLCDGRIELTNPQTGRSEWVSHAAHATALPQLAYTRGASALLTSSGQRLLELDPTTGAVRAQSPPIPGLSIFAVDPAAPIVGAGGMNGAVFWNLLTHRLTAISASQSRRQTLGPPDAMAFSPDGRYMAVGLGANSEDAGAVLILYDLVQHRIVARLTEPVSAVAFSPDGHTLAVGEDGATSGAIELRKVPSLSVVRTLVNVADVEPTAVAFSPDGASLAYGYADGTAGLVATATAKTVTTYSGGTSLIASLAFSPDGRLVATASADGTVRGWRASGLALRTIALGAQPDFLAAGSDGFVTIVSPPRTPGTGIVAQRWTPSGQPAAAPLVISTTPNVDATFVGPDGRLAGVIHPTSDSSVTGRMLIWNLAQRRIVDDIQLAEIPSGAEPVLSPNGRYVAMNLQAEGPPSQGTGRPVATIRLAVVDLRTRKVRTLASSTSCSADWDGISFNRASTMLAAGTFCGSEIGVWNLHSGRRVGVSVNLDGGQLSWTALSPDGRQLAIASWNGPVRVIAVPIRPDPKPVVLAENTRGVPELEWSPDGRYLATVGLDATIRVFNAHTLAELRVITLPSAGDGLAFTSDSRDILSFGTGDVVQLWDACTDCESPRALLRLARSRVTRGLTAQERTEFGTG